MIGKTLNVTSVKGKVLVRLPNGHGFVALTEARQLPVGTKIDALRGTIQLLAASAAAGKTQTGTFSGAVFGLTQSSKGRDKGLTTLSLLEGVVSRRPVVCQLPRQPRRRPTRGQCHGGPRQPPHAPAPARDRQWPLQDARPVRRRDRARHDLGHRRPL